MHAARQTPSAPLLAPRRIRRRPAWSRPPMVDLAELPIAAVPSLTAWERVKLARHPSRPHVPDYLRDLMADYVELHGDRTFGDDRALIGGLARFAGRTVMVLG